MKVLKISILFYLSLSFCSCENTPKNVDSKRSNVRVDEDVEMEDEVEEKIIEDIDSENQTLAKEEQHDSFNKDSVTFFYNKVLKDLFPNRDLSTLDLGESINVSPETMEDIEGGGMPTKHLRIMDEYDTEVGAIIYELGSSFFPNTYSIGVIQKDYNLVHAQLISMDGRSVLAIFSNTGGNPDKGPYVCSYFTYLNAYMHLEPIITTTVDEITKPDLSVEEIENAIEKLESINLKSTIPKKYFKNSFNNSVGE